MDWVKWSKRPFKCSFSFQIFQVVSYTAERHQKCWNSLVSLSGLVRLAVSFHEKIIWPLLCVVNRHMIYSPPLIYLGLHGPVSSLDTRNCHICCWVTVDPCNSVSSCIHSRPLNQTSLYNMLYIPFTCCVHRRFALTLQAWRQEVVKFSAGVMQWS